jgi:hypothetical protein
MPREAASNTRRDPDATTQWYAHKTRRSRDDNHPKAFLAFSRFALVAAGASTGAANEPAKFAVIDAHTEVLLSDFYRAGDGNDASFKRVSVIVADHDLAPDIDGIQNISIQQVCCGTAHVNFSS